jgi:hypothetical protein
LLVTDEWTTFAGTMAHRPRTRVTVVVGSKPRRPKKSTNVILAVIIFLLLGLFLLSRTRQVLIPRPQQVFAPH